MRQLIQHRLKTNIIGHTGHVQPRGKFVKKPLFGLRAIQGWTGLENCLSPVTLPVTHEGVTVTNNGVTVTNTE